MLKVKIDFSQEYPLEVEDEGFNKFSFWTELRDGSKKKLHVRINDESYEIIGNVYNLSFGTADKKGRIKTNESISHKDYSKVFSTILYGAMQYLLCHPIRHVGMDWASNSRAYLYYRIILQNYEYLNRCFKVYGAKYYVRIERHGKQQHDNPFDFDDIHPDMKRLYKDMGPWEDNRFNFFAFSLK